MNILKLFKIKGIGFIILAFAAGIVLLLLPDSENKQVVSESSSLDYASSLENDLEELLKTALGHECKVMITLDSGYSYTYAANESLNTIYSGDSETSKNVTKEYVITTKDGDETLVILKENLPTVKGVAVVCKKGGEAERNEIISIIMSLFSLPAESIGCVMG